MLLELVDHVGVGADAHPVERAAVAVAAVAGDDATETDDRVRRRRSLLAVAFARATGAGVILGAVFPIIPLRSYVHSRRYERLLREEADRLLESRADRWREAGTGIPVRTACTGSPSAARGLHALAREHGAALVVVGPSRRHGAGWTFPGPMGTRFAHGAPCPVAVVHGECALPEG